MYRKAETNSIIHIGCYTNSYLWRDLILNKIFNFEAAWAGITLESTWLIFTWHLDSETCQRRKFNLILRTSRIKCEILSSSLRVCRSARTAPLSPYRHFWFVAFDCDIEALVKHFWKALKRLKSILPTIITIWCSLREQHSNGEVRLTADWGLFPAHLHAGRVTLSLR